MSKLTNIFSAILGIEDAKVTPALSPENTPSWDSLNAIVLVSEVEKTLNVKFTYDEVMSVKTFSDVIDLVKSKGGNPDV